MDLAHNQAAALKGLASRLHNRTNQLRSRHVHGCSLCLKANFIIREAKKTVNARVEWLQQLKVAWSGA